MRTFHGFDPGSVKDTGLRPKFQIIETALQDLYKTLAPLTKNKTSTSGEASQLLGYKATYAALKNLGLPPAVINGVAAGAAVFDTSQLSQTRTFTFPNASGTLSLSGTPGAHATTHESGGSDAIKLDNLAAPDDNTDLDASITAHGLLKKLDNDTTHFLRGDGAWAAATTSPTAVDLTGQLNPIGATNIIASTAQAGMWRASVYFKITTAGAATDTVTCILGWNEGTAQAQFVMFDFDQASGNPTTACNMATVNQPYCGAINFYANTATAITYATTMPIHVGAGAYTLRIRLEYIG